MLNLDTLTSMWRVYWNTNNFSYFRLSPTNYFFSSIYTIFHTYESSIRADAIYDIYLTNLMLYEKYNSFALC